MILLYTHTPHKAAEIRTEQYKRQQAIYFSAHTFPTLRIRYVFAAQMPPMAGLRSSIKQQEYCRAESTAHHFV